MDLGLKGKKALVTGGTKGIGLATARLLAEEGCDVSICARSPGPVADTVASLKSKGVNAIGQAFDITNTAALKSWIDSSADEFGGIDILVSNVSALAAAVTPEAWQNSFNIDMMAMVNAVDATVPYLERSGAGAIVLVSSAAANEHPKIEGLHAYGAFKAGVVWYSKALADTYAEKGIRVNVVSPGATMAEDGYWDHMRANNPEVYETFVEMTAVKRLARPEEIAASIVFLASERASYIMGSTLRVEGGICNGVQY